MTKIPRKKKLMDHDKNDTTICAQKLYTVSQSAKRLSKLFRTRQGQMINDFPLQGWQLCCGIKL